MNRYELAAHIVQAIGAKSYLQVGSHLSEMVRCASARSVADLAELPDGSVFDVVLVDGAMSHGQARGAILGALDRLSPAGVLLVANVSPSEPWMAEWPPSSGIQLGEAWKAWTEIRTALACVTVASPEDHGVGVMLRALPIPEATTRGSAPALNFEAMNARREMVLGLVPESEVLRLVASSVAPVPTSAPAEMAAEPIWAPATGLDAATSEPSGARSRRRRGA